MAPNSSLFLFLCIIITNVWYLFGLELTGSGANITYDITIADDITTITLNSPEQNVWIGVAFSYSSHKMTDAYSIIYSSSYTDKIDERVLGHDSAGVSLYNKDCPSSTTGYCSKLISESIINGIKSVTIQRDNNIGTNFTFSPNIDMIYVLYAHGLSPNFGYHGDNGMSSDLFLYTSTMEPAGIVSNFTNIVKNGSSYKTFICNSNADCYFYCRGAYGCAYSTLNASNANNLYIECVDHLSCTGMDVYVNDNVNLTVICNNTYGEDSYWGSCEYINIYANNVDNVNIDCANHWDCYSSEFWIEYASKAEIKVYGFYAGYYANFHMEHVTNFAHILCVDYNSCQYTSIYCPDSLTDTLCSIECVGVDSCLHIEISIEDSSYNNLDFSCDNIVDSDDNSGMMRYNYTCIGDYADLTCMDTTHTSRLFYNSYDGKLSCHAACCPFEIEEIECNDNDNTCLIDCSSIYCEGHLINGTSASSLTVICDESDTVDSTCNGLAIYCPLNGDCLMKCNIEYGCYNMLIIGYKSTSINVECSSEDTCYHLTIFGPNSTSIIVNATAWYSFYAATIRGDNTKSLILNCRNNDIDKWDYGTCLYSSLYLSSSINNSVNINCWGKGCRSGISIMSPHGITSNMKFNIHSYCQCPNHTINQCISYWYLSCSNNYNVHSYFDGDICYDDEYNIINEEVNLCGCYTLKSILNNNYIDNDNELEIKYDVDCCDYSYYDWWWWYENDCTDHDDSNDNNNTDNSNNNHVLIAVICASIISVIIISAFIWLFYKHKKQNKQKVQIRTINNADPYADTNRMISTNEKDFNTKYNKITANQQ